MKAPRRVAATLLARALPMPNVSRINGFGCSGLALDFVGEGSAAHALPRWLGQIITLSTRLLLVVGQRKPVW